ncbi:hypothetical protein I7I50_00945 [Histoplasma capsulatum G186AR]|uniref:Uncharacterized protein n=1 Tax=Ajellomyces capsulatus TaxID=5037 RepID=A0A8H8CV71_AJECA|nr:hypothetical protein I7I52_08211 [Histoplasma capsulatum]QSS72945.1 hypothetical protein I7I50_00945 [Histoplasma capsulatum G186AR]
MRFIVASRRLLDLETGNQSENESPDPLTQYPHRFNMFKLQSTWRQQFFVAIPRRIACSNPSKPAHLRTWGSISPDFKVHSVPRQKA